LYFSLYSAVDLDLVVVVGPVSHGPVDSAGLVSVFGLIPGSFGDFGSFGDPGSFVDLG
jgi:hypothetical protein